MFAYLERTFSAVCFVSQSSIIHFTFYFTVTTLQHTRCPLQNHTGKDSIFSTILMHCCVENERFYLHLGISIIKHTISRQNGKRR